MIKTNLTNSWKVLFRDSSASTFLLLLLVADCSFFFFHFMQLTPFLNSRALMLTIDYSYPEVYQYIKELWIVVLLLSLLIKTRAAGYSAWALLFLYLLFDDATQIHEGLGVYIAEKFEFLPFLGLRARDFGELSITAMVAAFFLSVLVFFYVRGSGTYRQVTRHLLLFVLALAFFGVFVDMLHVLVILSPSINFLDFFMGFLEDGGEMLVMSFIVWYVYLLRIRNGNIGVSLQNTA